MKLSPKKKQILMIVVLLIWLIFGVRDLLLARWLPGVFKSVLAILFLIIYSDIRVFKD